jgi:hypothetical protein
MLSKMAFQFLQNPFNLKRKSSFNFKDLRMRFSNSVDRYQMLESNPTLQLKKKPSDVCWQLSKSFRNRKSPRLWPMSIQTPLDEVQQRSFVVTVSAPRAQGRGSDRQQL